MDLTSSFSPQVECNIRYSNLEYYQPDPSVMKQYRRAVISSLVYFVFAIIFIIICIIAAIIAGIMSYYLYYSTYATTAHEVKIWILSGVCVVVAYFIADAFFKQMEKQKVKIEGIIAMETTTSVCKPKGK